MQQTRKGSLIEAGVNILIGYIVAIASQLILFPIFDIHIPMSDHLEISLWFTIISLARTYIIRRWFNKRIHNMSFSLLSIQQRNET